MSRLVGGAGNDILTGIGELVGGNGDDWIDGSGSLLGGRGNDTLSGATGFAIGGSGDDQLKSDPDGRGVVLVGGSGVDELTANGRDALLIAGSTSHNLAAMAAIAAEWSALRPFDVRVQNLTDGTGSAGRLNGDHFLLGKSSDNQTVFGDDDRDELGLLRNSPEWIFATLTDAFNPGDEDLFEEI